MKIYEVLEQAKEIIKTPNTWTQGSHAVDINKNSVGPLSNDAVCWCLDGAILKATNVEGHWAESSPELQNYLKVNKFIYSNFRGSYAVFNDNHTHAEVIELLDTIIIRAKESEV